MDVYFDVYFSTNDYEDENRLLVFEMTCLRMILGVTRLDRIKNTTIRQTLGMNNTIIDLITRKRLRYHVRRMSPKRNPNIVLGAHIHGTRPRGRPLKRWEDGVKEDCKSRGLTSLSEADRTTKNRAIWQSIVNQKPSHSPGLVWTA